MYFDYAKFFNELARKRGAISYDGPGYAPSSHSHYCAMVEAEREKLGRPSWAESLSVAFAKHYIAPKYVNSYSSNNSWVEIAAGRMSRRGDILTPH